MIPLDRRGRARSLGARRDRRAGQREGRRDEPRLELARHDQPGREARRLGARRRARSSSATPRSPRRTCAVDVQALGADFVAISGHKMCGPSGVGALWGRARAAARDGAVPDRRPHDQLGAARPDDVGRAAAQVRGRHGADGGGGRLRRGDRLPRAPSASTRSRRTSTSSRRTRSAGSARSRASRCTGRRPSVARASSRSTSRASIRTTSRRSSTCRASRSAPAITAASR